MKYFLTARSCALSLFVGRQSLVSIAAEIFIDFDGPASDE